MVDQMAGYLVVQKEQILEQPMVVQTVGHWVFQLADCLAV